jgi:hypothetical protein
MIIVGSLSTAFQSFVNVKKPAILGAIFLFDRPSLGTLHNGKFSFRGGGGIFFLNLTFQLLIFTLNSKRTYSFQFFVNFCLKYHAYSHS